VQLNVKAFALSTALISGTLGLVLNILSILTGWAKEFFELIAPFHPGYSHTFWGALISAFWMFVYGYIVGAVFVFIYNFSAKD
jgi:hypothetical protein